MRQCVAHTGMAYNGGNAAKGRRKTKECLRLLSLYGKNVLIDKIMANRAGACVRFAYAAPIGGFLNIKLLCEKALHKNATKICRNSCNRMRIRGILNTLVYRVSCLQPSMANW